MKLVILLLVLVCLTTYACVGKEVDKAAETVDNAVRSIDKATAQIERTNVGWQNIVTDLGSDLPKEAHDLIANDVDILSRDVIGATITSAMCTLDFVKLRALQTLKNLKARLLKQPLTPVSPGFCTLTIPSIDLNDPLAFHTLNVFGFDLNTLDKNFLKIQAALVGDSTYYPIPEKFIGRTTNYQIAVNLTTLWPDLAANKFSKLKLYWNRDSANMPEVLVQPWKAVEKLVRVDAQTITFVPPHEGPSDRNFDTESKNWASGNVHMEFMIDEDHTQLSARIYMTVMEFGGDNTLARGYSPWTPLYTVADKRFQLQDFSPNAPSDLPFNFTTEGPRDFYPAGCVSRYTIQIDHPDDDAGSYTMVTANLNEFSVKLVQIKP